MELETLASFDDDIEDGELDDSDDGYTPLQRPETKPSALSVEPAANSGPSRMDAISDDIDDSPAGFRSSSDSSSDSDDCLKVAKKAEKANRKESKRTVMIRVKAMDEMQDKKARFKKYDIWTASLQEESLTENMRGIDVARGQRGGSDRNVENYDYALKYRLNGGNGLKRRLSNSGDELSDGGYNQPHKRSRPSGHKKSIKERLGRRNSSSSCDSVNAPRNILDLNAALDDPEEVARDIATKLCEERDDLLMRIVDVLGVDLPIQLFKETQRIEKDGGMMIMNGNRRRTPGGVFLFLLKHNDTVSSDDRKRIFVEEKKTVNKERKTMQAIMRDQKVEELKKRLSEKEKQLQLATTAKVDMEGSSSSSLLLKPESITLSNPPPSPVGQEHSPEYKSHAINHDDNDAAASPAKPSTSENANDLDDEARLTAYDDDFLDMHCDDMDLF